MISKNPLLGLGIGNWKFKSIEYDGKNMMEYTVPFYAHNDFLQIGAEIGILGLAFYLLFIIRPFLILIKKIYSSKEPLSDFTINFLSIIEPARSLA